MVREEKSLCRERAQAQKNGISNARLMVLCGMDGDCLPAE